MQEKTNELAFYKKVIDLANRSMPPSQFLKEELYEKMSEAIFRHWISACEPSSSRDQVVFAMSRCYHELHKLNLFVEMMLVDEFDNFLVFVIAERFTKDLQGHKALIGASAEDLSELVSDKVWDECRKSDAYMINLERDIAKYMSNAVKLRFYGSESVSADEVVAFIHEYYRVEKDKNEPVMEHDPAVPEKPQTRGKFAAFFEALREKRKSELTLLEISKRCSISKSMLEAFLSGKAHPKRDTVFKLAYGLKLSQAQLVEMMDAIDQDLKSKAEHKPYKINRSNPRDMLLFNELPNRLSIEDLNARLVGSRFQALDQTPLSRAF